MKLLHSLLIGCALAVTTAAAQTLQAPTVPLAPQTPRTPEAPSALAPLPDVSNAYQTRDVFQQLLRQYSPYHLSEMFRLDPALLTNTTFLAPFPNIAAFVAQHPEIVRNPTFFVGSFNRDNRFETPEGRSQQMLEEVMAGIAVFTAGTIILSVLCWIVKTVIDHRRWLRVSKVQSDVHSKLLDRFTSNQDLLTYIQTPAGRHFLESAPISIDPAMRALSAPMSRILFSVQAGVVLAFAGLGLNIVSHTLLVQEIAQPLYVVGALALALGIGFVLSAFVAYIMSRRLGLLDQTPLASTSDNAGVSPPNA